MHGLSARAAPPFSSREVQRIRDGIAGLAFELAGRRFLFPVPQLAKLCFLLKMGGLPFNAVHARVYKALAAAWATTSEAEATDEGGMTHLRLEAVAWASATLIAQDGITHPAVHQVRHR